MKNILKIFLFIIIFIIYNCSPNGNDSNSGTPDEENPIPTLNTISPHSKVSHLPSFTLTVTGETFIEGSKIIFNGTEKQTTYISSSELRCQIEPEDITSSQAHVYNNLSIPQVSGEEVPVLVNNPSPGGGNSNSLNFIIYNNYEFKTGKNISNYPEGRSSNPSILTDNDGNATVIWDDTRLHYVEIFFSRTTDKGTSWSEPRNITHYGPYPSWQNSAGIDNNNNMYVIWRSKIKTGAIYYTYISKSTDDGQTWTDAISIPHSQSCYRPRIGIGNEGIYVVWKKWDYPGMYDVYFTRSLDRGTSWSRPINISNTPNRAEYIDIITNKNGRIYVAWFDSFLDERFIYFTKSTNKGLSWGTPVKLDSIAGDEVTNYPKIAYEGDKYVYLFWKNKVTQEGPYQIFFKRSTDGGETWNQKKNLSNNESSSRSPSVVVDSVGNINLVWSEHGIDDAWSIYFSRSIDRGNTWTVPISLTSYATGSFKPDIAVDNECNLFITWHNRIYDTEIFTTTSKK
jgi:hypothetical protein